MLSRNLFYFLQALARGSNYFWELLCQIVWQCPRLQCACEQRLCRFTYELKTKFFVQAWWWAAPFLLHKASGCTGVVSCRWRVETGLHGVKLHVPCLHWALCRRIGRELAEKLSQCRNISELRKVMFKEKQQRKTEGGQAGQKKYLFFLSHILATSVFWVCI